MLNILSVPMLLEVWGFPSILEDLVSVSIFVDPRRGTSFFLYNGVSTAAVTPFASFVPLRFFYLAITFAEFYLYNKLVDLVFFDAIGVGGLMPNPLPDRGLEMSYFVFTGFGFVTLISSKSLLSAALLFNDDPVSILDFTFLYFEEPTKCEVYMFIKLKEIIYVIELFDQLFFHI